jgi:hypothetical protein
MGHKMSDLTLDLRAAEEQKVFCAEKGTMFVSTPAESKLGFALKTKGKIPINGLRHPVRDQTSGWYVWCGDEFSEAPDFFDPVHAKHVYEDYPNLVRLLGLPPGYRFLVSGDYVDIWYDNNLLNV